MIGSRCRVGRPRPIIGAPPGTSLSLVTSIPSLLLVALVALIPGSSSLSAAPAPAAPAPTSTSAPTWRSDAYVWQRRHDERLAAALAASRERVSGFYPLAAEVAWATDGAPRVTRVEPDHAALIATGRPVGLVLRVAPFSGPFSRDPAGDSVVRALTGLARDLLADAREAGLRPAELQIDFDCAERTLAGYREWLLALREAAAPTPLVFTALPAWLRHEDEFAALAGAADGFVLQVHSLEKPRGGPGSVYSLSDYEDALRWAAAAARIARGRPFRVALPTYGYRLAFDGAGEFFALSAEGPAPSWPADTVTREVRSDPAEMLRIERALATEPPPGCAGVIWFRLPVEGDRLNWAMPTFLKELAGEVPAARLEVEVRWTEAGLAELVLTNRGDAPEPAPAELRAAWPETARLMASDGLGGYETIRRGGESGLRIKNSSGARDSLLGPGKTRRIAWLRFADETTSLEVTQPDAEP